jgi:hypothetical protein
MAVSVLKSGHYFTLKGGLKLCQNDAIHWLFTEHCMLKSFVAPLVAYVAKLRFPTLFKITLVVFVVNLLVPDMIPFLDEIILGLGTALLAAFKKRNEPEAEPEVKPGH